MRVHIVNARPGADRILPRLARCLMEYNGWSLGTRPKVEVDLNYFMNYIPWCQSFYEWDATPMAAYFTHKDVDNYKKAEWWDNAAKAMDLCITSAPIYLEELKLGHSVVINPPVDTKHFTISPLPDWDKPVIGVSGYTYEDNRKGEDLIGELVRSPLAEKLILKASGRGWPITTVYYHWANLPEFFQELDVLVVPSKYEGVPMPPLEAMACGIKVVVPEGVGLIDELPDIPGIYRYACGDFDAMSAAIEKAAFGGPIDRAALRKVVEDTYTSQGWAQAHLLAFEDVVYKREKPVKLPSWQGHAGAYVVAFGKPSRKCAVLCINSIRKHMPGLPVALVSSEPLGLEDVFIRQPDKDVGGRIAKVRMDNLAPEEWEYLLYLDADTELIGDASFLFQLLQDGWEFVICKDMGKFATTNRMVRPDNKPECKVTWDMLGTREGAFQYNGGMMAYRRCPRTVALFETWIEEWDRWGKRDQAALLRALYRQPLQMYVLMNQWNASDRYTFPPGELVILHHNTKARRWSGLIDGRTDSKEAWAKVAQWERQHGQ